MGGQCPSAFESFTREEQVGMLQSLWRVGLGCFVFTTLWAMLEGPFPAFG